MNHDAYPHIVAKLHPHAELLRVVRLTGGVSADVHRLDLRLTDDSTRSLVLRAHRPSHAGHPAELEFQLLAALRARGLAVPEPLLVDVSGRVLDAPYLVIGFVEGSSELPTAQADQHIDVMADALAAIHDLPTEGLPTLPLRNDPLPEVFDFFPAGREWEGLLAHLRALSNTEYTAPARLLHGDFWPGNLLWRDGAIASILDWEDAALGDPLSDVACCRLELRYKFGPAGARRFTQAYGERRPVDRERLALWQVYVAAAAQRYMGMWGLDPALEAHMRAHALASIREAGEALERGGAPTPHVE